MRDVVLALGCSFTDPNFRADNVPSEFPEHLRGGWKMWPEIFTDRLSERDGKKYKLVNLGKSGTSMQYAFRMFFEQWSAKKQFLKVVLWGGTQWSRLEHETRNFNTSISLFDDNRMRYANYKKDTNYLKLNGMYEYVKFLAEDTKSDNSYIKNISVTLNKLVAVADLCRAYDIDFIFYPLLNPFTTGTYKDVGGRDKKMTAETALYLMMKAAPDAYNVVINSKNFIGASVFDHGWVHWSRKYSKYKKYEIADDPYNTNIDRHPNAEGQKQIANEFWVRYENAF